MENIHYYRRFITANRQGRMKFEGPKVEAVAACYAKLMGALAFSLALFKAETVFKQAKKRRW